MHAVNVLTVTSRSLLPTWSVPLVYYPSPRHSTRSLLPTWSVPLVYLSSPWHSTRSLLPTWSVPLVYYPSPWHSTRSLLPTWSVPLVYYPSPWHSTRSLLPTWSVPLVYYPSPRHSAPKTKGFGSFMMYCSTDWRARSQKVWEIYPVCVRERTVSRMCTLAFIAFAHGAPASSLRLCLVLGTSFARQLSNPMMPYGRPGRVAKPGTMLVGVQRRGKDYSRLACFM